MPSTGRINPLQHIKPTSIDQSPLTMAPGHLACKHSVSLHSLSTRCTAELRVRPHDAVPASACWVDGYCAYPPLSLGSALAHERHFHDAVVHGPVATPRMYCLHAPTLHGSGGKESRWKSNVHVVPIDSDGLFRSTSCVCLAQPFRDGLQSWNAKGKSSQCMCAQEGNSTPVLRE